MMTLIIGGSGSGKSAYAEEYTDALAKGYNKYYLATMQVLDKEAQRKVDRHRSLRNGKNYITIEQQISIQNVIGKMQKGAKCVLLECISNLVANEMFLEEIPKTGQEVTEKVINGMEVLKNELTHFVVVSNNVFEDGMLYDEATMEYIQAMGWINERLANMADSVVEVVVGIPVVVK